MKTDMTREELIEAIRTLPDADCALDGEIHDRMDSRAASSLNNDGIEAQVDYLLAEGVAINLILAMATEGSLACQAVA